MVDSWMAADLIRVVDDVRTTHMERLITSDQALHLRDADVIHVAYPAIIGVET